MLFNVFVQIIVRNLQPLLFLLISQALQIIANAFNVCGGDADLYFHQGNLYKDLNEMQQAKKVGSSG